MSGRQHKKRIAKSNSPLWKLIWWSEKMTSLTPGQEERKGKTAKWKSVHNLYGNPRVKWFFPPSLPSSPLSPSLVFIHFRGDFVHMCRILNFRRQPLLYSTWHPLFFFLVIPIKESLFCVLSIIWLTSVSRTWLLHLYPETVVSWLTKEAHLNVCRSWPHISTLLAYSITSTSLLLYHHQLNGHIGNRRKGSFLKAISLQFSFFHQEGSELKCSWMTREKRRWKLRKITLAPTCQLRTCQLHHLYHFQYHFSSPKLAYACPVNCAHHYSLSFF